MPDTTPPLDRTLDVAVIGAGFGGLCMAKRLLDERITDFLVFDRADRVGGTWQANTYPGAQCDIPAALYSLSFAPKYDWSRLYPLQPELQEYLAGVARDFGIEPHLRLGHDVVDASWSETERLWTLSTGDGTWRARVLVGAFGPFSAPSIPTLPGLESFAGQLVHSANWDHGLDWEGKRIGVVGTGASAVQIIPRAAEAGTHLTVFQRTATWILPHPDRPIPVGVQQFLRRAPLAQRALRLVVDLGLEAMVPGLVFRPHLLRPVEFLARRHLRAQVADPGLRRALTPDYAFGCKRPTFSDAYYPALAAAETELVCESIDRVVPGGVVTADGTVHDLDVLILATGFTVAGHPFYSRVHDGRGRSMAQAFEPSPQCYLGTAVSGFPNMFQMLGPNAAVYTSMVTVIEAQVEYIIDAIGLLRDRRLASLDVRPEVVRRYVERIDRTLAGSVWNTGGCASYYLDRTGRNIAWFPGFNRQFAARTRRVDPDDYIATPLPDTGPTAGDTRPQVRTTAMTDHHVHRDESYAITARDVHFRWDGMPLHYIPDAPMAVHVFNAMHLVLPEGERAMSAALAEALPLITDERLAEEVRGFIGQETVHADSHRGVRDYLAEQGLDSETTARRMEWLVDRVLGYRGLTGRARRAWLAERLGLFSAMEHYTAVVGQWFLTDGGLERNGTHPEMIDLLKWHGAEEVEHRSVVFDAFQYVDGSYPRRVRTAVAASAILAVLFLSTARSLYRSDPHLPPNRPHWIRALYRDIAASAVPSLRFFLTELPVYLRRDFDPRTTGDMDAAIAYLARSRAVHHGQVRAAGTESAQQTVPHPTEAAS